MGVYSIGKKIADNLQLISYSFQMVWLPAAMSVKNDPNAGQLYRRMHDFYVFVIGLFFLTILLFRTELIDFFAPAYHSAFTMIFYLGFYNLLNGIGPVYSIGMHIRKKTKYLTYAAIASVIVDAGSSILLVHYWGINGVAIGSMFGGIVWTGLRYYFSQRLYKIDFAWTLLCVTVFISVLFYFVNPALDHMLYGQTNVFSTWNLEYNLIFAKQFILSVLFKMIIMLVIAVIFVALYDPEFLKGKRLMAIPKK
jgi:O-antigen/teichoic acid export membrane protein